jgi:hypothetical protein
MRIAMKKFAINCLLLLMVLSAAAQLPDNIQSKQQTSQPSPAQTTAQSSIDKDKSARDNSSRENVTTAEQVPRNVQVKMVENTVSGESKQRQKLGSAVHSGPVYRPEKKSEKSKCTQADLKKALKKTEKMEQVRPTNQE